MEQRRQLLLTSCKTSQQLKNWIKYHLNIDLPDATVSRHSNCNPFDSVWQIYDVCVNGNNPENIQELLYVASRGSGKTLGVAIAELLVMLHDQREVAHVGAILSQAKRCYEYQTKFLLNDKIRPVIEQEVDGTKILDKMNMDKSSFNLIDKYTGESIQATIEVLPCTLKACLTENSKVTIKKAIYHIKHNGLHLRVQSGSSILTTNGLKSIEELKSEDTLDSSYYRKKELKRPINICPSPNCGAPIYSIRTIKCEKCKSTQTCTTNECGSKVYKRDLCRSHYEEQRSLKRGKCNEEGCNNYISHRGLCSNHYRVLSESEKEACSAVDCYKPATKRRLCCAHYQQYRIRNMEKVCSVESCTELVRKKGLCFKHWFSSLPADKQFARRIRTRITNDIKRVSGSNRAKKIELLLGCSIEQVRQHLESQFQPGMTWENHGEWHIDHILPVSSAKTLEELENLQHYTNLQPLWAQDNFIKSNKGP
jgi:hypothetical protein